MAVDHIRYDILAREALRGVVRTVLRDTARNGLPGEHHFYISFDTRAEGVQLSPRMLAQYPEEMTVVLQHQFWDLVVTDDGFEVGMSFGGVPERVTVPFGAIKGFFDPSVQFGLQFEEIQEAVDKKREGRRSRATKTDQDSSAGRRRGERRQEGDSSARTPPALATPPAPANPEPTATPAADPEKPTGEVVRLDRFRKK
jgi:uncharacterized protein